MIVQTSEATFSKPIGYVVDLGSIRNRLSENETPILSLLQITRIKKVLSPALYYYLRKKEKTRKHFFSYCVASVALLSKFQIVLTRNYIFLFSFFNCQVGIVCQV